MKHDKLLQFQDRLKAAGLKTTAARVAIVDLLSRAQVPLSAKDISAEMPRKQKVDQATIYRNLEALTSANIIRLVNFQHDHNHYELVDNSHHHHAICKRCGKVVDISGCDLRSWGQQVKTMSGFAEINQHALEFFGLCKSCSKK